MIKTLSPYSTAKTAEIMSRYRPIAPKPEGDAAASQKIISQSPYLRKLWPQLQARPTRTRKRGRSAMSPPISSLKRTRTMAPAPTFQFPQLSSRIPTSTPSLVTLALLSPVPDLNRAADQTQLLDDKCLLTQLNDYSPRSSASSTGVISPRPLRPVGSTISVGCINEDPGCIQTPKTAKEVEEEIDSEILPAVVSDSNNKVRLVNSAYKEMVGQPECRWLETMVGAGGAGGGGRKQRISGEVRLSVSSTRVPVWAKGFSCWVRIEWEAAAAADGKNTKKKKSVNAFCDVTRLDCESRDYFFTWRFHTRPLSSQSSSSNARAD